jgi:hypothetical protein
VLSAWNSCNQQIEKLHGAVGGTIHDDLTIEKGVWQIAW